MVKEATSTRVGTAQTHTLAWFWTCWIESRAEDGKETGKLMPWIELVETASGDDGMDF